MYRLMLILVTLFIGFHAAHAQTDGPKIKGGVLNGKAKSLPKPVYPIELNGTGEKGIVRMDVVIDEVGSVISAVQHFLTDEEKNAAPKPGEIRDAEANEQVHPLLVEAARTAVMEAKFSPTMLSGVPVKVSGMIVYNFRGEPATDTSSAPASGAKMVTGGVLNGKATSLPNPEYPPAARAVRASGAVTVQVEVDENGDIVEASAVSGHPLLRASAVAAAREAKFSPTMLQGQPVRIRGVITYNFAPPPEPR
ncbi:hypothetical protein BH24ACI3_BH24ACI3_05800 [soil metagenome]